MAEEVQPAADSSIARGVLWETFFETVMLKPLICLRLRVKKSQSGQNKLSLDYGRPPKRGKRLKRS